MERFIVARMWEKWDHTATNKDAISFSQAAKRRRRKVWRMKEKKKEEEERKEKRRLTFEVLSNFPRRRPEGFFFSIWTSVFWLIVFPPKESVCVWNAHFRPYVILSSIPLSLPPRGKTLSTRHDTNKGEKREKREIKGNANETILFPHVFFKIPPKRLWIIWKFSEIPRGKNELPTGRLQYNTGN